MSASEFELDPSIIYLNHAAVAPWPRRTEEAVRRFAQDNALHGARDYPAWLQTERSLREQARTLLNAASADDIALLKNTSEALSVVAHGLPWQPGDNVVICDQEFPSNRIVWESLRPFGVEVRIAALASDPEDPEASMIALVDHRTRVLAVSSVQYATGLRMDLARLSEACRARGILFCVDAIQSLGALRLDLSATPADFVMADAHKWMLGPEGIAVFYCSPQVRDRLVLRQYGWHMVETPHDFDRRDWTIAHDARRFECGSPNMLGMHAAHASLSLLLQTGMQQIERGVLNNASYLIDKLRTLKSVELLSPTRPERRSGIVTFRPTTRSTAALFERLRTAGVICAERGGGIRFSPHFYITRTQLDTALEAVGGFLAEVAV